MDRNRLMGVVGSVLCLDGWLMPKGQNNPPSQQQSILVAYPCPTQDCKLDLKCNPQRGKGIGMCTLTAFKSIRLSLLHIFLKVIMLIIPIMSSTCNDLNTQAELHTCYFDINFGIRMFLNLLETCQHHWVVLFFYN